jgi:predicted DNA-binding transcriptional regulator YafY
MADDDDYDGPSLGVADRRRLAPERFKRIWQLVEDIARSPGKSRKELASQFALSERQVQADLNVIRREMGLPLLRRQGYRFVTDEPENGLVFTLAEAGLLLDLLTKAVHDPSLPAHRLRGVMAKLPSLFPLHLRPLVTKTLESANGSDQGRRQQEIFASLADALLRKSYVKLHYPAGDPLSSIQEPIVLPEVLFPYCKSWHLIGTCRQRGRIMVFDLDSVVAVTAAVGI